MPIMSSSVASSFGALSMPLGLHLLWDTTVGIDTADKVVVDIVAVHGLGADPNRTWVSRVDAKKGITREVMWLEKLLPSTLENHKPQIYARVFCFNYSSDWLGRTTTTNRLESIATALLDGLYHRRLEDNVQNQYPLVFLGHSFGGLVIEAALCQAGSSGSQYSSLVDYLGGILFLGTPHRGSSTQKVGHLLAKLGGLAGLGTTVLMKEVDQNSMKINDLVFKFMELLNQLELSNKHAILCIYENQETAVVRSRIFSRKEMIVTESSATLPGQDKLLLNSDHVKLNKFHDFNDSNYQVVSANLTRIAANAANILRERRTPAPDRKKRYNTIDRALVRNFVGREGLLQQIATYFSDQNGEKIRRLVLHAMGGEGKSQLTLKYCDQYEKRYRGIFWIDASSYASVLQSYWHVATRFGLQLPSNSREDLENAKQVVKDNLAEWAESWILVFDNYDNLDLFPSSKLKSCIPNGGRGDVVITSRRGNLERLGHLIRVPPLTLQEAIDLLFQHHNEEQRQSQHSEAALIVERLGRLALAIDQTASYIRESREFPRLSGFLAKYENQRRAVLCHLPEGWEYSKFQIIGGDMKEKAISAFTTWEMSFQCLGHNYSKQDISEHLLSLSAFLNFGEIREIIFKWAFTYLIKPADILMPEKLFTSDQHEVTQRHLDGLKWLHVFGSSASSGGNDNDSIDSDDDYIDVQGELSRNLEWESDRFWRVVHSLQALSLVRDAQNSLSLAHDGSIEVTFSLHPLIRDWLQIRGSRESRIKLANKVINLVYAAAIWAYDRNTSIQQRAHLLLQVNTCMELDQCYNEPAQQLGMSRETWNTAIAFAEFYCMEGLHNEFERLYRIVVDSQSSKHGKTHEYTLECMLRHSMALYQLRRFKDAETSIKHVLSCAENSSDKEDPMTLVSMTYLSTILNAQHRYDEAEPMMSFVADRYRQVLPLESYTRLQAVSTLAQTYLGQKRYEAAAETEREVLRIRQTTLGRNHQFTLQTICSLAMILHYLEGHEEEAIELLQDGITRASACLGPTHHTTLSTMHELAKQSLNMQYFKDAEDLALSAMEIWRKMSGPNNVDYITNGEILAISLHRQGKLVQATNARISLVQPMEAVYGPDDPKVVEFKDELVRTLMELKEHEAAENLQRQILNRFEAVHGNMHILVLKHRETLAMIVAMRGKREEAISMYDVVLEQAKVMDEVPGSESAAFNMLSVQFREVMDNVKAAFAESLGNDLEQGQVTDHEENAPTRRKPE